MNWRGAARRPRFGNYARHQHKKAVGDIARGKAQRKRRLRVYEWAKSLGLNEREQQLLAVEIFS